MFIFLLLLTTIAFLLLLIVAAIRPHHSELNLFELERRSGSGDEHAKKSLVRERLLGDVTSLQRILVAILQVIVVILSELTFGIYFGILIAFFVALIYGSIARIGFIKRLAQKFYGHIEESILSFIQKTPRLIKILRSSPMNEASRTLHINSRQELQHLVAESDGVLSLEEKRLIVNSLSFNEKLVREVMTPKYLIDSVKKSEFLGPLALDDLHKTGHSKLPVIASSIDHVVGILHLESLLALNTKRSTTAEKAMEKNVYYIHQDQTIADALTEFLSTRSHMLIVIDEDQKTVGLLTLADVIEALIGRKIIDEFESHNNPKKVAMRKSHRKI